MADSPQMVYAEPGASLSEAVSMVCAVTAMGGLLMASLWPALALWGIAFLWACSGQGRKNCFMTALGFTGGSVVGAALHFGLIWSSP